MIYDRIVNAKLYSRACKQLLEAVAFAKKIGPAAKDGRYALKNDAMYAILSSYRTKIENRLPFEAHRKYIDVQFLLKGEERIDVAQTETFKIKDRYSPEKDIVFIHCPPKYSSILLEPGQFVLLYPHDFHRPAQSAHGHPEEARKLVIKIRVKT